MTEFLVDRTLKIVVTHWNRYLLPCLALSAACGQVRPELELGELDTVTSGGRATAPNGAGGTLTDSADPPRASGGSRMRPRSRSGGASSGGASSGGASSGGASSGGASSGGASSGGAPSEEVLPPSEPPWELEGRAFELVPEGELSSSCADGCQPLSLLFERVTEDTLDIIWGAKGHAERYTFVRFGEDWKVDGRLSLGQEGPQAYPTRSSYFDGPIVRFQKSNREPTLELTLSGMAVSSYDQHGTSFPLTLRGRPDTLIAAASLPENPVSVLTPFWFPMTKPLQDGARARIIPAIGEPLELIPTTEEGFVVSFSTPTVLPYSLAFAIEVTGNAYTGLNSPLPVPATTEPSFGTLLDSSFSAATTEGISGGTLLEVGTDSSSNTVLHADIGELVVLRLAAQPEAHVLRLDARVFTDCEHNEERTYGVAFLALVIGGEHGLTEPTVQTLGDATSGASLGGQVVTIDAAAHDVTVPLSGPADGDVILMLQGSSQIKFNCFRTGALIDNVRLE